MGGSPFAVFPIGDVLTMGIEDAIEAAQYVKVKHVLGVHYDTFELIKIEKPHAINEFGKMGLKISFAENWENIEI